jgi:hypothetical protein
MKILSLVMMTAVGATAWAQGWKVIGWNDLGMHCVDGKDYSIYSILPPFNTFHAQVVNSSGKLVKSGVTLTYQAVADSTGSINKTSVGKSTFWQFSQPLYGATLAPDKGLAGFAMPGAANTPQRMRFDSPFAWFTGEGVPILPYDDKGTKNFYPMMRLTARNSSGTALAFTDIVLPVSDEMNCLACHASGSTSTARPAAGWAFLTDPEKDYKRNVLRLHDEREANNPTFRNALAKVGLNLAGLSATVDAGAPCSARPVTVPTPCPAPASPASVRSPNPCTRATPTWSIPPTSSRSMPPTTAPPATAATRARKPSAYAAPWATPLSPTAP